MNLVQRHELTSDFQIKKKKLSLNVRMVNLYMLYWSKLCLGVNRKTKTKTKTLIWYLSLLFLRNKVHIPPFKSKFHDLSRRFPNTNLHQHNMTFDGDRDLKCQIRKISSLFGTLGRSSQTKQMMDFQTYPNFPDLYLKRSIDVYPIS